MLERRRLGTADWLPSIPPPHLTTHHYSSIFNVEIIFLKKEREICGITHTYLLFDSHNYLFLLLAPFILNFSLIVDFQHLFSNDINRLKTPTDADKVITKQGPKYFLTNVPLQVADAQLSHGLSISDPYLLSSQIILRRLD